MTMYSVTSHLYFLLAYIRMHSSDFMCALDQLLELKYRHSIVEMYVHDSSITRLVYLQIWRWCTLGNFWNRRNHLTSPIWLASISWISKTKREWQSVKVSVYYDVIFLLSDTPTLPSNVLPYRESLEIAQVANETLYLA